MEMNWSLCCCGAGAQEEQDARAIAAKAKSAPADCNVGYKEHLCSPRGDHWSCMQTYSQRISLTQSSAISNEGRKSLVELESDLFPKCSCGNFSPQLYRLWCGRCFYLLHGCELMFSQPCAAHHDVMTVLDFRRAMEWSLCNPVPYQPFFFPWEVENWITQFFAFIIFYSIGITQNMWNVFSM